MITTNEYNAYAAYGCADLIEADRASGHVAFMRALQTATTPSENRVDCARIAFDTAAHYRRLFQLDGLDDYARRFAMINSEFYSLRGTLLLSDASEQQINNACGALLKKYAPQ